jgi:hypothetical protein
MTEQDQLLIAEESWRRDFPGTIAAFSVKQQTRQE